MRSGWLLTFTASVAALVPACSAFETTRAIPPRGTLGHELFSLVCDRVGAQALRDDIVGASFHAVCHGDAEGHYATSVDTSKLPPFERAQDESGQPVDVAKVTALREHGIARVEALARRREDLVAAIDALLPDTTIALRDIANPDPAKACDVPADESARQGSLHAELAQTLSRMIALYQDETVPNVTRALGNLFEAIGSDAEAQKALARLDAREGYRPPPVALGVARPFFAYPGLEELSTSALRLLAKKGDGRDAFERLLGVLNAELRFPAAPEATAARTVTTDALQRPVPSRLRTGSELARQLLLDQRDDYGDGAASDFIVARDPRSFAAVAKADGSLPAPFVDADGDGLPDLDDLGRFVTSTGTAPPSPFAALATASAPRDFRGRAVRPGTDVPLYGFVDTRHTLLGAMLRPLTALMPPATPPSDDVAGALLGALPVLLGPRETTAASTRTYTPAGGNPSTDGVQLAYRAFRAEASPIADLIHALGTVAGSPEVDDALALAKVFAEQRPNDLARFVGLALEIQRLADAHPEAHIPARSTLWDELLVSFADIAQTPGIFEDLLGAIAQEGTMNFGPLLATWIRNKDLLGYQRDPNDKQNLAKYNGAPASLLAPGGVDLAHPMAVPVDRSRPDTGENRSALQRVLQLLHDTNGLAACTKPGAVAQVRIHWPPSSPVSVPISLDYPNNILAKAVCAFVGSVPADPLPACGILRIKNVAELLLDVTLKRAQFEIPDTCLRNIVNSPILTGIVGGADAFLEETSGIKGFSLHPTVNGVARLVWTQTPYSAFPLSPAFAGDDYYTKPRDFIRNVIDPVPSMVCPETPLTYTENGVTKTLPLRTCRRFEDTLRGRDEGGLFPLETMDFMTLAKPIAAAFADHGKPLLFVDVVDTLHRHWGSAAQTKDECDPSLPRTDARWCSQDGAVTYEPLLAELLEGDVLPAARAFVLALRDTKVAHCNKFSDDGATCLESTQIDGVTVAANAARLVLDPKRWAGLANRKGQTNAVWNDGRDGGQTTPMVLALDALNASTAAFDAWAAAHPGDTDRKDALRRARSRLVDAYFSVDGKGPNTHFASKATAAALPLLVNVVTEELRAACTDRRPGAVCKKLTTDAIDKLASSLSGPLVAAGVDVLEVIRSDATARQELEKLLGYLLDPASPNDAMTATIAAAADLVQVASDDTNLRPFFRILAAATAKETVDDKGNVVARGFVDSLVDMLVRVFTHTVDDKGVRHCADEVDPNGTFSLVAKNFVTPMENGATPLEVFASVIADVNRAAPADTGKLTGDDYASIAANAASVFLDPASGLEQLYTVLRQATEHP